MFSGTLSNITASDNMLVVRFTAKAANTVNLQFDLISADIGCSFPSYDVTGNLYRSGGYICPLFLAHASLQK